MTTVDSEPLDSTVPEAEPQEDPSPALNVDNDDNDRIRHIFQMTTPPVSRPLSPPPDPEPIPEPTIDQEPPISQPLSPPPDSEPVPEPVIDDQPPDPPQPDPFPSDPVVAAEQSLMRNNELPPLDIRSKVYQRLMTDTLSALMSGLYDRATDLKSAAHYISKIHEQELYAEVRDARNRTIADRLALAHKKLNQTIEEWQKIKAVFANEQKADRSAISDRHIVEQEEFEEAWANPAVLTHFSKPSPQLLFLRRQQKKLALARDFSDAKKIRQSADSLEQEEIVHAEIRAGEAMRLAFRQLQDKQRREMECFEEHQSRIEFFLETERENVEEPIRNLIRQLEHARDRDKPTNLNPRARPFVSSRRTRVLKTTKPLPVASSPRTIRVVADFKIDDAPEKLQVATLDVRKLLTSRLPLTLMKTHRPG
jgi:hypothetical protein